MIFEDPFYALLAYYNVLLMNQLFVVPTASAAEELWSQRQIVLNAIKKKTYDPSDAFIHAVPIIEGEVARIKLLTLPGDVLLGMRTGGSIVQSLEREVGLAEYVVYSSLFYRKPFPTE